MRMRKVLSLLTSRHAIVAALGILVVLEALLIANIFFPQTMSFVVQKHIFEPIVIATLAEVVILLATSLWHATPIALWSEEDAQQKILAALQEDPAISSVKVLSAGLRARASFLRTLLEMPRNLNLEVVACFGAGSPNPDELDRETLGPAGFEILTHRLENGASARLRVLCSHNTPSFRCILLYDGAGARCGVLGWYTYRGRNTQITGRRNVQVFVDRTTEVGNDLLRFAERTHMFYMSENEADVLFPQPIETEVTPIG